MGDYHEDNQKERNFDGARGGFRGGRGREGTGFRIRLSDNEMKATRSLQEAFNLRSTVAVLGFSVRTLGQMLEDGKLDHFISEYRSQSPRSNSNQNHSEKSNRRKNLDSISNTNSNSKPNPFERPSKPESQAKESSQKIEELQIKNNLNQEKNSNNSEKDKTNQVDDPTKMDQENSNEDTKKSTSEESQ